MGDGSGFQISDAAAGNYARLSALFMRPLVEALLDAARPRAGERLLDLACGTGIAARAAADRVGPTGRIVGADVNPGMIATARDLPATEPPIEWHVASAMDLPFGDASFDVVVAQQGIQFFGDLATALSEMRRVTAEGGRVAATAWTSLEDSPYFEAQYAAIEAVVGDDASSADRHAAFRLGADDLVQAWEAAGLADVRVEVAAPEVELPPMDQYAVAQLASTPWGGPLLDAGPDAQARFVERITELLADRTDEDGTVRVPFSTHVVVGTA